MVKLGTYVNAIEVAEPPLVVLAACAVVWVAERGTTWRVALVAAFALLVVQSGSLLVHPADPRPYTRPFAESGPRRLLSDAQVSAFARQARACPPGAPYPGIPFVAFVAGRPAPGDQPDVFILRSQTNAAFALRYRAALSGACPAGAPVIDARGNAG